ncbi:DUF308 domain-containing protein [Serratia symbiotica]|uniref:DUF308 domain-containing protein n=1 Tax=Serratia symbiotica TaxID=138074 RepID=UPI001D885261|nr:DUF308 domain-containing protein [Serratia symbiotica]NIG87781.1 acid-resistance protein [Serratia symbiotica]USS95224.1 DUF308 domain-containing protein [Serratia symbiotica]
MLNLERNNLPLLSAEILKKQRTLLLIIAFLLLVGGILLGLAYLIIGYVFITSPMPGILVLAVYLAVLFTLGGIARLVAGYSRRGLPSNWLLFVIGVLDLIIAWMLVGSGPIASVTLVTTIVGIEMLISSFGLFQAANLFKRS